MSLLPVPPMQRPSAQSVHALVHATPKLDTRGIVQTTQIYFLCRLPTLRPVAETAGGKEGFSCRVLRLPEPAI